MPGGHSVCVPVSELDTRDVLSLVSSLEELLGRRKCELGSSAAVSAAELGVPLRVILATVPGSAEPVVMINPHVVTHSAETVTELSTPGESGLLIEYFKAVTVKFKDLRGEMGILRADEGNGLSIALQRCLRALDGETGPSDQATTPEPQLPLVMNS